MRTVNTKDVEIAKLVLPGDYGQAAKSAKVAELRDSIGEHGLIQRIGVEAKSNELVWGRKRVAAFLLLKQAYAPAEIVEFDDALEKEEVTIRENIDREEATAEERRAARVRLAEIAEQRAAEKAAREAEESAENHADNGLTYESDPDDAQFPEATSGKSKTAKSQGSGRRGRPSKGREEAARAAGVSTRQLRSDLAKAKGSNGASRRTHDDGPVKPPIETLGLDVPAEFLATAGEAVAGLKALDGYLIRAKGELTKLVAAKVVDGSRLQRIRRDLDALAQDVRNATPVSVCVYCKRRNPKCQTCLGSGLMVAEQQENVPKELKKTGADAGIFVSGKFKKLSEMVDG